MDEQVVQKIVDEVLSSLEPLDTQSAAVLQFLKAKGIASDEELAPYLEQAGNASSVRWLAARVRIKSLLASAMKTANTKLAETKSEETKPTEARRAEQPPRETERSKDGSNKFEASAETNQPTNQGRPSSGEPRATDESDENKQADGPASNNDEKGENSEKDKANQSVKAPKKDAA